MRMNTVFLVLGICIVMLLVGAVAVVFLASSSKSQKQRMEEQQNRHVARQPWDAQSADGRGNR
jgi:flagellar basal body-associated protein FliL